MKTITHCLPFVIFFISCNKNTTTRAENSAVSNTISTNAKLVAQPSYGRNVDWLGKIDTLTMDIYMPDNMIKGKRYPLVMSIHGGGYKIGAGSKKDHVHKCQILADSGFIAAAIDYRVGWYDTIGRCIADTLSLSKAIYRALQDANAAMRYLVLNADKYGIDTNWIFVSGNSAGASVSLNTVYINDAIARAVYPEEYAELGGLQNATNKLTGKFNIKGICSIAGALPDSNLITKRKVVPAIFFQGSADEVIPVDAGTYLMCPNFQKLYGSLCLYRRTVANNKTAVANILQGSGHENSDSSGYNDEFTMSNAACFFHSIMKGEYQESRIYNNMEYSCH